MYNKTKLIKNINASLEKQEGKKFLIEGRLVNMGKVGEPGEKEVTEPVEEKPKKVKTPKKKVAKKSAKKKK